MAEEDKVKELKELMKAQARIRNVCTSAHIHHGKCISGDSRIILANGMIKLAREIFEDSSNDGLLYKDNEDYTIFIPKQELTVFSLNKDTGKLEKRQVKFYYG